MRRLQNVLEWLLNPPRRVTDGEQIQQSRLLSAVLLVLTVSGAFVLAMVVYVQSSDIRDPVVRGGFVLVAITAAMYALNRFGYTRLAAAGIILPSTIVITYIPLASPNKSFFLAFLLIPIILTTIFFRLRWAAAFAVALLAVIYAFLSRLDQVSATSPFWNLRNMWFLLILTSGLIVTFVWHLRTLEAIRRSELKRINAELGKDIQIRTQTEYALRQSEARLRALVENSPDFILEIDRIGNILFINRYPERYVGKNIREIMPSDQLNSALNMIARAFNTGEPQTTELQTYAPNGRPSWDSVRVGPVKHAGNVTSLTVIMTDVTVQKNAEMNLRESEERYRGAMIGAGLVPYVIDYETKLFTFIGDDIYKLTGYKPGEFTPALMKESVLEDYMWGSTAGLKPEEARTMFRAGALREWHSDMRIRTRTGETRWISDSSVEIVDDSGKAKGAIGIFQDITERKHIEAEREAFIKELGNRNAELERFTYTVSHELKSPLITIAGYLGVLEKEIREGNYENTQKNFFRISNAIDKMQKSLSDLLELSKVGLVINPFEEIRLTELVQEALETVDGRVLSRKVNVQISPDLPVIYGDRLRLREVFENLIDNAAKYTGSQLHPLIEIGNHNRDNETILFVRDNGLGIEPQYHTRVFNLFEKLNPSSEGTGIGLTLVKRIIEMHGGRMWVESDGLGKGSTFYFTLPKR